MKQRKRQLEAAADVDCLVRTKPSLFVPDNTVQKLSIQFQKIG